MSIVEVFPRTEKVRFNLQPTEVIPPETRRFYHTVTSQSQPLNTSIQTYSRTVAVSFFAFLVLLAVGFVVALAGIILGLQILSQSAVVAFAMAFLCAVNWITKAHAERRS